MKTKDDDVRKLLDIIATSMDFGSGFLETEDIWLLREVATDLGLDPWDFTPANHPHEYREGMRNLELIVICLKCFKRKDENIHFQKADRT